MGAAPFLATGVAGPTWRGSPGGEDGLWCNKRLDALEGLAWELKLDPWAGRDTPWFSPYDLWGASHGAR